jgi:hypothetical protein
MLAFSLRAVGSQLVSTSKPMALCRATDDPFVERGVFSSRRG